MSLFGGSFAVYDSSGKQIAVVASKKSAVIMARAILGSVRKGSKTIYSARNPVTKKKKKKRTTTKKRAPAKKNKSRKPKGTKKKASKGNPGAALRKKIASMKPNTWYPTKLSGASVRVKRKGSSLIISAPAKKRR